jgi:transcriptional repressor NrdR
MERVEEVGAMVIKKDGTREKYDTNKLKRGIIEACSKTRVDYAQIEKIIEEVTKKVYSKDPLEIDSYEIGKIVADELKKIDKVAYIRFASVFKEFIDVGDFKRELKRVGE